MLSASQAIQKMAPNSVAFDIWAGHLWLQSPKLLRNPKDIRIIRMGLKTKAERIDISRWHIDNDFIRTSHTITDDEKTIFPGRNPSRANRFHMNRIIRPWVSRRYLYERITTPCLTQAHIKLCLVAKPCRSANRRKRNYRLLFGRTAKKTLSLPSKPTDRGNLKPYWAPEFSSKSRAESYWLPAPVHPANNLNHITSTRELLYPQVFKAHSLRPRQ